MSRRSEETRRKFAEVRTRANAVLESGRDALSVFRATLEGLFAGMAAERGGAFDRKPNISLRLIADGLPLLKLIVLPHWSPRPKRLDPRWLVCELVVEEDRTAPSGEVGKHRRRLLTLELRPDRAFVNLIHLTAEEDTRRVVATIRSFTEDSRAVLARSCDHCCICGRKLTDELSRGRGIGPECIKVAPLLLALSGPSIIVPEPTAGQLPMASSLQ